jgi:hypothetical protein
MDAIGTDSRAEAVLAIARQLYTVEDEAKEYTPDQRSRRGRDDPSSRTRTSSAGPRCAAKLYRAETSRVGSTTHGARSSASSRTSSCDRPLGYRLSGFP